jgi:hypothetical protein
MSTKGTSVTACRVLAEALRRCGRGTELGSIVMEVTTSTRKVSQASRQVPEIRRFVGDKKPTPEAGRAAGVFSRDVYCSGRATGKSRPPLQGLAIGIKADADFMARAVAGPPSLALRRDQPSRAAIRSRIASSVNASGTAPMK